MRVVIKFIKFQSTHPCGVRRTRPNQYSVSFGFNPRTRVGCDAVTAIMTPKQEKFQSTHPCGVRLAIGRAHPHRASFNPRTRVGCDVATIVTNIEVIVSIHAPVWGATQVVKTLSRRSTFQSTHPCGVRPCSVSRCTTTFCFNPRTRVGCDKYWSVNNHQLGVSIHAPVWGATTKLFITA